MTGVKAVAPEVEERASELKGSQQKCPAVRCKQQNAQSTGGLGTITKGVCMRNGGHKEKVEEIHEVAAEKFSKLMRHQTTDPGSSEDTNHNK